jgi:hypothetical protein
MRRPGDRKGRHYISVQNGIILATARIIRCKHVYCTIPGEALKSGNDNWFQRKLGLDAGAQLHCAPASNPNFR